MSMIRIFAKRQLPYWEQSASAANRLTPRLLLKLWRQINQIKLGSLERYIQFRFGV
jgi:hypothetical protein